MNTTLLPVQLVVSIVKPIHDLILCTSAFILTLQATNKIELDPDAFEKLKVVRGDFMKALEDINPVCGTKTHQLAVFCHFTALKNIVCLKC